MAKIARDTSTLKILRSSSTKKVVTQCCDGCAGIDCSCFSTPDVLPPYGGSGKTPFRYLLVIQGFPTIGGEDPNGDHLLEQTADCTWNKVLFTLGTPPNTVDYCATIYLNNGYIAGGAPEGSDFLIVIGNGQPATAKWGVCPLGLLQNIFQSASGQAACKLLGILQNSKSPGGTCDRDTDLYIFFKPHLTETCDISTQVWFAFGDYLADESVIEPGLGCYICKVDHTAELNTRPGHGADWRDYWILVED